MGCEQSIRFETGSIEIVAFVIVVNFIIDNYNLYNDLNKRSKLI